MSQKTQSSFFFNEHLPESKNKAIYLLIFYLLLHIDQLIWLKYISRIQNCD